MKLIANKFLLVVFGLMLVQPIVASASSDNEKPLDIVRVNPFFNWQNARDKLMIKAAERGGWRRMRFLLLSGGDVNLKDKEGCGSSLLHIAVFHRDILLMWVLLDHNADLNATTDKYGLTPLHLAIACDWLSGVEILLNHENCLLQTTCNVKVNANIQDCDGLTPLHYAAQRGNAAMMALLLNHTQDLLNVQDKDGSTPLHYAVRSASEESKIRLVRYILAEKNLALDVQNRDGNTALHYASRDNNMPIVQALLDRGADATIQNKQKKYPHELATCSDVYEKIRAVGFGGDMQ